MIFSSFMFLLDPHQVLEAILRNVVLGPLSLSDSSTDCAAAAAPAADAVAASPVFVRAAAMGASDLCVSQVRPPEHAALAAVFSNGNLMRHATNIVKISLWLGPWTWPPPHAVAWVLHNDQQHLFETHPDRVSAAVKVGAAVDSVSLPLRQRILAASLQEQQLRCHRQQLRGLGVTEGFGALPRFAAGAADMVTVLLSMGVPVDASRFVQRLTGTTAAAAAECAKAMVAAVLAVPVEQLLGKRVEAELGVMSAQRMQVLTTGKWLCVSPSAVHKAVDVGDMDLITLLMLCNQRMWGIPGMGVS
jgi:hypothetical protein